MSKRRLSVIFAAGLAAAAITAAPVFAAESDVSGAEVEAVSQAEGAESVAEEVEMVRPEYRGLDFVTLGEYKGLTVEVDPIDITEEAIDARIESEIRSNDAGSEELTEGTVTEGDVANIDFEGKKDGVAFDGGKGEGYDLEIGSGTFIPGFEEGLVGVSVGDTVDIDVTFPENYGNADLAGQPCVFTVTVNSIRRYKELDDELASALSEDEAATVADYREWIKGMLAEEALTARADMAKTDLLQMAAENTTVNEYPEDLVEYTKNDVQSYFESYASMYGVDLDTFLQAMLGMTEEEFPEKVEELAKENIRGEFAIDAIAETESLLPEGEELTAAYDDLAMRYGYGTGEQLIAVAGEYSVHYALEQERVRDFLYENANIVERAPEAADSMAESAVTAVEEIAEVESAAEALSDAESIAS